MFETRLLDLEKKKMMKMMRRVALVEWAVIVIGAGIAEKESSWSDLAQC